MKLPILQDGDSALRIKAKSVPSDWFGSEKLKKIIVDLADTVDAEEDGVAIAAPQVGLPYRIFLVRYDRMKPPTEGGEPPRPSEVGVFVNPSFVRLSKKSAELDEGCLSVRNVYGRALRKERATIRAYDERGTKFERGAGGLLAQAFQHEMDHLDGVLFVDHATELTTITDEERERTRMERHAERAAKDRYEPA